MPQSTSRLTRKGRVRIPTEIRKLLQIGPHDLVAFVVEEGNQVRVIPATDVVARAAGMLKGEEPMRSPREEEDNAEKAIAAEAEAQRQIQIPLSF